MRYFVEVAGRTFVVRIDDDRVEVDGESVDAELRSVPGTLLRHLLIDGASHALVAEQTGQRGIWEIYHAGERLRVSAVDERTRAIREMAGGAVARRGPRPVRAPMPGMVVRIEVEPGQAVETGQGVAVIEAMKMENELRAEGAGVVMRVLVQAGQAVEKGAVLVEFEDV